MNQKAQAMASDFGAGLEFVRGARKVPPQKPGKSKQNYGTPTVLLDAVKKRFGIKSFAWDLAAEKHNAVNRFDSNAGHYYGPDHTDPNKRDTFLHDWTLLRGDLWLNPEFGRIGPYVEKCAASACWGSSPGESSPNQGRRIFLLVPAAVGSNWFAQHVFNKSLVLFLNGRIPFDGCPVNPKTGKVDGYIKDCLLACYGMKPGVEIWRWDGTKMNGAK